MGRWDHTHAALQRTALELFAAQGYDSTGTAQIARRAGVSEMTLFRHFPAKEGLLLADPFDPLLADAVRARPQGESAMHALVEGIRQAWSHIDDDSVADLRGRLKIVAETDGLRGAVERSSADTMTALADALVARGIGATAARVAASAVISGLTAALLAWAQADGEAIGEALDAALAVLAGE